MAPKASRMGATLTLVGILGGMYAGPYVIDRLPNPLSLLASWSHLADTSGPEFKVEYGYFRVPALDCTGGRCQPPTAKRLKVQSMDREPISINDVVVNDRPECPDPNKMGAAGLVLALVAPAVGIKGKTMSFGDVGYVLSPCEPVTVRVETDKGESAYHLD